VPIAFTAIPDQPLVQGVTESIEVSAVSMLGPLPVSVEVTVSAASTTTYDATTGGSGTVDIPVPAQTVMGTTLIIDSGSGAGDFTPASNGTAMVVRLTSAVLDMTVTSPIQLPLVLDASPTGDCVMLGDGVALPVAPEPPSCEDPACLFCPPEALDPTVAALFPDGLNVPIDLTAVPDQPLVQGATELVTMSATSVVGPLPVAVEATLSAASTTTYDVVAGGSGTADVPVPAQTVTGTTLSIDAGSGAGAFTADGNATDILVRLTSAVFDMTITQPLTLPLVLDASPTGDCVMTGHGVSLMVDPL
jgi:hypothetical protein